jgi:hypothetical protein
MKLEGKNILIVSPEAWGNNYVSKHHYAISLAKRGNNIYFLNPPTKQIFSKKEVLTNLWVFDFKPKYRGLGRLPAFISAMLTKWEFNRLEILISVKIDIIWNFDSSRFFNLYRINSGVLKISSYSRYMCRYY